MLIRPKDHQEAIALFRSEIVGSLLHRDLDHGELAAELRALSAQRFRAPDSDHTRRYSVATLERWYYALKRGGLEALRPEPRSDRGRGRALSVEQRALLLDIRRENPSASVPLILRTLVADGRLDRDQLSATTLRRLFRQAGMDRVAMRDGADARQRLRWQAARPDALWHGDVCHGPAITFDGVSRPLRIHALLDDCSRFLVALEAHHTEREDDMLMLLVRAIRRHGAPDALYLDNGATYRGDMLRLACARLGITLVHARPYDPQARGKMERFWRTLREGCLDHLGAVASLHDVSVRLHAFVDQHYHLAPHASLMGRAPSVVYCQAERPRDALDEAALREALTERVRRRVRRDTTVPVDGVDWELAQGHLAGQVVTVARCLLALDDPPWVEHDGRRYPLHPCDPEANARRPRFHRRERPKATTPFDPPGALLDRAAGRPPRHREEDGE
jgi:transposase InsO family protein